MEGKKISFGFTKTRRAPDAWLAAPVQSTTEEERRDYIDCVEEKAIIIVGGEVVEENKPLVIPMKPNTLVTAERLQQIAAEVEASVEEAPPPPVEVPEVPKVENETLEQQVERELLEEARNVKKVETQVLTIATEKLPPLEGQKESTLEDYESVPISDFGMAMLRGMGWTPGTANKYSQPVLRPKGLGLGADKLVKQGAGKGGGGKGEEELKLKKACHVRLLAGKHSAAYGKVVSLDDESGRVLVELAMGRECVSVSEHMLEPVTKQHYDKQSRVINSDKYEEYKMKEQLAKERNEKSDSKKTIHGNAERSSRQQADSSRQDDNASGTKKQEYYTPKRRDSSGEDRNRRDYKESKSNDVKPRRRSGSEEYRKSHNSPDAQRSTSSNGKDKYKRELRKSRERSSEDRRERISHNEPSQSRRSSSRGDSRNERDKNARNRSSSEDRIQRKSRKERKASSTSSEDSRTRRKNKSKRDDSSGNESLCSLSSGERRRPKKSKKKKSSKSEGKRDIDKKRKGKKKKRDRDRSPIYRKHKR